MDIYSIYNSPFEEDPDTRSEVFSTFMQFFLNYRNKKQKPDSHGVLTKTFHSSKTGQLNCLPATKDKKYNTNTMVYTLPF